MGVYGVWFAFKGSFMSIKKARYHILLNMAPIKDWSHGS